LLLAPRLSPASRALAYRSDWADFLFAAGVAGDDRRLSLIGRRI
jgi:hypothetical protein